MRSPEEQARVDRAAIEKLGEFMQHDRRRVIDKSTVRVLLGLDEGEKRT